MVGVIAASIDIVTNWLGDLKDGFCRPSFYLSRTFCCWQIDGIYEMPPPPSGELEADTKEQIYHNAVTG